MYTAILNNGKVFQFTVKACAELYVQAFGGVIIEETVYAQAYAELLEAV